MTDAPLPGQAPAQSPNPEPGETPATDPAPTSATANEPAGETPTDDFDKERALATIRKLRETEKAAKAQEKTLADLKAKLDALEAEKLTEEQRKQKAHEETQAKAAEAQRRADELAAELRTERIRAAIERAAAKQAVNDKGAVTRAAFIDPSDATRFIDLADVETDDAGKPTNVDALLARIAKDKPHLLRTEPKPTTGATTNPARSQASEPREDDNARYQRLYGFNPSTIFDPATAAQRGGGVRWSKPPE